jgi:U4/U6 small nuclear ribonucleoprotein PRP31
MATLAESFLADLEELEEDEEYGGGDGRDADAGGAAPARGDLAETLKYDNLDSVAPLVHSERYRNTMQARTRSAPLCAAKTLSKARARAGAHAARRAAAQLVEAALAKGDQPPARIGPVDEDPEYKVRLRTRCSSDALGSHVARVGLLRLHACGPQLIVDCNALTVDIDNEIVLVHNFIRDKCARVLQHTRSAHSVRSRPLPLTTHCACTPALAARSYRSKFPELESLVLHPIDYARVVKAIGNEMDMTLVDLDGVLPSATIMVVSVTGSTTNGTPLSEEVLGRALEACERALQLDETKRALLRFVESRMAFIAPNLSAVLGTQVAAQLMGTAGGLVALSRMPACNVQVLGAKRKALGGMSSAAAVRAGEMHAGFIFAAEVVQQTPPPLRMRACRLVGGKCTLMARLDAYGEDPAGTAGAQMRADIVAKIAKWQEPPPAKFVKPLPLPDMEPKKRRGGRRLRKMKQRYGLTDMRKAANRVNFNQPEEEAGLEGVGIGVLGSGGAGGRLRLNASQSKKLQKDAQKFTAKKFGSSGVTSGLSSSLAFTPIQGIELVNPTRPAQALGTGSGTDSVFSTSRGFSKVERELRQA